MIKKIALAAIFAAVSVVSFTTTTVNAQPSFNNGTSVGSPVMKGFKSCGGSANC